MRRVRLLFQEGNLHVHQEQGLRRSSDADPDRRCRRGRRDVRQRRHPVLLATAAVDIFSPLFGSHHSPSYVLDVLRQGEKVGQPIILFRASNFDPAEDFVVSYQGLVSDFFAAGLVSAAVELHYGGGSTLPNGTKTADDPAFEIEYAPYSVQERPVRRHRRHGGPGQQRLPPAVWRVVQDRLDRGLTSSPAPRTAPSPPSPTRRSRPTCRGTTTANTVTYTQTTTTTTTLGSPASIDNYLTDDPTALEHGYAPAINGSDTNFSHPFVLTYSASGHPTDKPRPQLFVSNLTGFSNGVWPDRGCREREPAVGRRLRCPRPVGRLSSVPE